MKLRGLALILLVLAAGCGGDGGGGGGGSGGNGGGSGGDGGDGGSGGSGGATGGNGIFTVVALPDDTKTVAGDTLSHAADIVSAIYFDSATHGLIGTMDTVDPHADANGGGIFASDGTKLTKQTWAGYDRSSAGAGYTNIGYRDFRVSGGVIVATTEMGAFTYSSDNGETWTQVKPSAAGIDETTWASQIGNGPSWWVANDTGIVYKSDKLPSADATYTRVWAPESTPTVPDPVPADGCQEGPVPGYPTTLPYRWVYASPDGSRLLFPRRKAPGLCITTDSGATFNKVALPDAPAVDSERAPGGVYFTDALHGWVFFANDAIDGSAYVYRTLDGGLTWVAGTVPAALLETSAKVSLRAVFFAPDNKAGYIVGYHGNETEPLLLKSTDGGATWSDISSSLNGIPGVSPPVKLYSVFALDAKNVWVGGDYGLLLHSTSGGVK